MGSLNSILDPNLIRSAMLQGLEQRERGFEAWLAGKEQARYLADQDELRRREEAKETAADRKTARRREGRGRAVAEPYERRGRELASARDTAQTEALTGRVPTRMSTIGMQTFATPDPLKMSGAQRMQFLPGNNALRPEPTRMDLGGLTSDAAFAAMISGDRNRFQASRY
jgi:hypothetical protein